MGQGVVGDAAHVDSHGHAFGLECKGDRVADDPRCAFTKLDVGLSNLDKVGLETRLIGFAAAGDLNVERKEANVVRANQW